MKHIEKVRAHAEQELAATDKKPSEILKRYKKFLKIEEHRLKIFHRGGGGGLDVARRRADLLDLVLKQVYQQARENQLPTKRKLAIIATGGYGRGTLNPHSDIDLLFLHSGSKISRRGKELIEQILYLLWDVGYKVGHATRSIRDTISIANQDNVIKSSLIESRFITGDRKLFKDFQKRFHSGCIVGYEKRYLLSRAEDHRDRHRKYYQTVFVQEPNVKNGCGGLRDYQSITWVCYLELGSLDISHFVKKKIIAQSAYHEIQKAYDFLMRVRNELHYETKRASDILTLRLQGVVATRFNYPQRSILRRSEAFMKDYYQHTRNIYQAVAAVMQHFQLLEKEEKNNGIVSFLTRRRTQTEKFDGFYRKGNLLYVENVADLKEFPEKLMQLFQHAQLRHLDLSPQLVQIIVKNYPLISRSFRYQKEVRETFIAILSRKGQVGRILRMMHRVDFLGRYLPEFGALTCLVQHEFFHRYTADEHTLVCIEKLDALSDSDDPKFELLQKLFHEFDNVYVLYLALLLHDVGKATNHPHHSEASTLLASKVSRRLQLPREHRQLLLFLVDHHGTLSKTSFSKNIDDAATIGEFSEIVSSELYLDALLLLTFADMQGTSEESWSDWRSSLALQLYHATRRHLAGQVEPSLEVTKGELITEVTEKFSPEQKEEAQAFFESMPARYFTLRDKNSAMQHLSLFQRFFRQLLEPAPESTFAPVLEWTEYPGQGSSEVLLCSWDRHFLLANFAGVLATQGINILSADIYTRSDDLVLDIFRVCTTNFEPVRSEKMREKVYRLLVKACSDSDFSLEEMIEKTTHKKKISPLEVEGFPSRVVISNKMSAEATYVEIQALDRLGLLYDVFSSVSRLHLEITHSRISTEKGAAIDSFYITDSEGEKIRDTGLLEALRRNLLKAVTRESEKV